MRSSPFWERLAGARRVLLAGCGGGYDVFGAIPLLAELEATGREVLLANLTFTNVARLPGASPEPGYSNLYAVTGALATETAYCPEAWLARFLEERRGRATTIWAFDKTGVKPLRAAYAHLVAWLGIDALVLVDGGVDALLRGDESSLGTPEEDLASVAAVHGLDLPVKLLACIGMGTELKEGICHEQVLERIAELAREGGYLGASALAAQTAAGALYREAVEYTLGHQQKVKRSHIQGAILAALRGEHSAPGEEKPRAWISALTSLCWSFDLGAVARTNLLVPHVEETEAIWDISVRVEAVRKTRRVRDRTRIPI